MQTKLVVNDTEFTAEVTGMATSPNIPRLDSLPDSAECTFEVCSKGTRTYITYRLHRGDVAQLLFALTNGREQRV